jgi:hypothetical protein
MPNLNEAYTPQDVDVNVNDELVAAANYLWGALLKHLQKSQPKLRKGRRWAPSSAACSCNQYLKFMLE